MKYDYEFETIVGNLTPNDFLDHLAESYAQLLAGFSEIKGNTIYLYNYHDTYCGATENFESDLYDNRLFVHGRDEYSDISRLEFFALLDSVDKAEERPEVIEFTSWPQEDRNYEGVFKVGNTKIVFYKTGKLLVDTNGLNHPDAELFYRQLRTKLVRTDLAAVDRTVSPF